MYLMSLKLFMRHLINFTNVGIKIVPKLGNGSIKYTLATKHSATSKKEKKIFRKSQKVVKLNKKTYFDGRYT